VKYSRKQLGLDYQINAKKEKIKKVITFSTVTLAAG